MRHLDNFQVQPVNFFLIGYLFIYLNGTTTLINIHIMIIIVMISVMADAKETRRRKWGQSSGSRGRTRYGVSTLDRTVEDDP